MTIQNKSAIAETSIQELLYSGVHFGHKKRRWNPKMAPFIFGSKGDIHIINLDKTKYFLDNALSVISRVAQNNGKILFVGTKHQASPVVKKYAEECNQFYVNHRWLGGMLTNWSTVSNSIKTLEEIEKDLANPELKIIKKERLQMQKKYAKLSASLGGIRKMGGRPSVIFVIDTNKESIAIQEAAKLGIPIIAVVDTNSSLEHITHPVPGNDDSIKSISLFCKYVADTINKVRVANPVKDVVKESVASNKVDAPVVEKDEVASAKVAEEKVSEKKAAPAKKATAKKEDAKDDAKAAPAKKAPAKKTAAKAKPKADSTKKAEAKAPAKKSEAKDSK